MLEAFKHFQANVERQTGRILKCIRLDNGGEYRGLFAKFCKENCIKHERNVPKTPRQNGEAERVNRIIVERIQQMLSHAILPKSFWSEAMMIAIELINLSSLAPLNGEVPNSFCTGK